MRILCVENEPGAAQRAVEGLRAGGHEVVRCFEHGQATCVGLDGPGACPLDQPDGVDVVLAVRAAGHPAPAAGEVGVTCALRRRVPLAVAGSVRPNPFARWTGAVAEPGGDVVAACQVAERGAFGALGAEVTAAVCRVLGPGCRPEVDVRTVVRRQERGLAVTVYRPASASGHDADLAVRAHRALRDAGVTAPRLSISCADSGAGREAAGEPVGEAAGEATP